ncbi:MAG TPA: hypothetical protein VFA26_13940 [Gemmataceae bacterium]|nr:hypothetical protein [Gemmataceae bacterium]
MHGHDKTVEALAKKLWDGKLVEVTAVSWSSHQDQKTGDHAGETLFGFDLDEAATGQRTGNTLAVYFKDADDIATLKARKPGDKTPFKVRGKLVADPKVTWRIWLVDARLVKE